MNASSKIKKSIIAIIISLCLIAGAIFGIIFAPKINSVNADYNYGDYNENGYYDKGGVVFYGVKVRLSDGFDVSDGFGVSENEFKLSEEDAVEYTINFDAELNPITVTWTEDDETKTTPITNNEFTLGGKQYYYSESENKIIEVSYWPAYTVVTDSNGKPETIKFGEAVLLEENEAILICFARQDSGAIASSAKVDY